MKKQRKIKKNYIIYKMKMNKINIKFLKLTNIFKKKNNQTNYYKIKYNNILKKKFNNKLKMIR